MKMETVKVEVPTNLMKAVRTLCNQYNEPVNTYLVRCIECELKPDLDDKLHMYTSEMREDTVKEIRIILEGRTPDQATSTHKEPTRDE